MISFISNICNDICEFLNGTQRFFFNERDLQMHLATFLCDKYRNSNINVEIEYRIPKPDSWNNNVYPWSEDTISLDLVVIKDGHYVPIEIKYKTRSLRNNTLTIERFGDTSVLANTIVKNQSAQDIGRYAFWKDVKRIELLTTEYPKNVIGGIALFVTNDNSYTKAPKSPNVKYYDFRMNEGELIRGDLLWKGTTDLPEKFSLEGTYKVPTWLTYETLYGTMYYNFIII